MMITSCPGFLDRYGIWNNGFDCSSPRVCCGIETDRYCCIPSTSSQTPHQSSDDFLLRTSANMLPEKWLLLQMCTVGIFLTVSLLILVVIYQCLTSIRRNKPPKQRTPCVQVPLPAASPHFLEYNRSKSNRISTISSVLSDGKSRCTDTSMILSTPLNLYPATNSSSSTSSSYYQFPSEFEHLCK